jgi:phosphonoacetaldehyde hydrolase
MTRLKAVVLDWAGTVLDFGSRAPMGVFVRAFAEFGVSISVAEAREPMGMAKRDHIAHVLRQPRVAAAWEEQHGRKPGESDIDAVYHVFVPMNVAVAADYAVMIPGAVDTVRTLRKRGLKIGSTTGYTRDILDRILPVAAAAGYAPDNLVCAGDLAEGRPRPLMMYRTFADLGVYPPESVVKVDDTPPGIGEGVQAGTWTVGVAASGNEAGLSLEEWSALDHAGRSIVLDKAAAALRAAGADYVIETIADLPSLIDPIEQRLAAGERPAGGRG